MHPLISMAKPLRGFAALGVSPIYNKAHTADYRAFHKHHDCWQSAIILYNYCLAVGDMMPATMGELAKTSAHLRGEGCTRFEP